MVLARAYTWFAEQVATRTSRHPQALVRLHVLVMRRLVRKRLKKLPGGNVLPYLGGSLEVNPDDVAITWGILQAGVWSPAHVAAFQALLREGDAAIDVGANIGTHSLPMGRLVGAAGHVLALEPEPINAAYLKRNITANRLTQVTVMQVAASDVPGSLLLFLAHGNKGAHSTNPSALKGTATQGAVEVKAEKVDNLAVLPGSRPVRLVKVDVQGAEARVLRGSRNLIARDRPWLLLEYSPAIIGAERRALDDELGRLVEAGYALAVLAAPNVLRATDLQALGETADEVDLLCRPPGETWPSGWQAPAQGEPTEGQQQQR